MADSWTKRTDGSTVWSARTGNVSSPVTWTQTTRPTTDLFNGRTGVNTTFGCLEFYNLATLKWHMVGGGHWTTATRPTTTLLDTGSVGVNDDTGYGLEEWDGTNWSLL